MNTYLRIILLIPIVCLFDFILFNYRRVIFMGEKTKVLVIGIYHFKNNGGHLIDIDSGDITTDEKQKEINEVIQNIAKFRPNKIAVEVNKEKEMQLNEAYAEYCKGNFNICDQTIDHRTEIVQLGFRLAQMLSHTKVYPIDHPVPLPDNVYEYAKKNCPEFYREFMKEAEEYGISENNFIKNNTVREILRHLNNPERNSREHSNLYLRLAKVGAGDTYYGVDMLTEWYRRNLCILGNLQSIAKPEDRIMVFYGAGHCKILQNLVRDYNEFELIDPLSYL